MRKLIYCTLLLLSLSACKASSSADTSLFSDTHCSPPCWQNLTPGISTLTDVQQFLNGLQTNEQKTIKVIGSKDEDVFGWVSAQSGGTRQVCVKAERLTMIEIIRPDVDLQLGMVVDYFGPPEYLYAAAEAHGEIYVIHLYYPSQGIAFISLPKVKNMGDIKPDMLVDEIHYFVPGDLASYSSSRCWGADYITRSVIPNIQPWSGFGRVQVSEPY